MNILFKLLFCFKKPKLAIVFGDGSSEIVSLIFDALKKDIKSEKLNLSGRKYFLKILKSEMIIVKGDFNNGKELNEINFLIKKCSFLVLVLSGDFIGKDIKEARNLLKAAERKSFLVAESHLVQRIEINERRKYGVGFEKKSDICVSDLNVDQTTNFKINHKGNIVPFWFDKNLKKKEIIFISLAVGGAMVAGLNLVQISRNLKK